MNTVIEKIVGVLKRERTHSVRWDDAPYQTFAAEWQDWGFATPGSEMLYVGYWYEQNGDLCPDPNICIEIFQGEVKRVHVQMIMGGVLAETPGELLEIDTYLNEMWERHCSKRLSRPAESIERYSSALGGEVPNSTADENSMACEEAQA